MKYDAIRKIEDDHRRRRQAIDELHFVYLKLGHLLTALVRRVMLADLGSMLTAQYRMGRLIDDRLVRMAFEHGIPARPCVCEEAATLVDEVYQAERKAAREMRPIAIVDGLRELHVFLLRTWQVVIELTGDNEPEFRREVVALQQQEAELHRELVELGKRLAA